MADPEPFLKPLSTLAFGQPSPLARAAYRLRRLSSLEELFDAFGKLVPAGALGRQSKGPNSRQRLLSAELTFWAFLAQVLGAQKSCRAIVEKLEAWWRWLEGHHRAATCSKAAAALAAQRSALPTANKKEQKNKAKLTQSAYCQARARLPLEGLELIQRHLGFTLEKHVDRRVQGGSATAAQRRVLVVDGTTLTAPDTPENQARWPQPSSQKPRLGFPLLKLVGLFSLASGALLEHALGNEHDHELTLLHNQLLDAQLKKGDVLLGDRGFCTFTLAASLLAKGADGLFRLRGRRGGRLSTLRFGKRLGQGERLLTWHKPQKCPAYLSQGQFARLPESLSMRLVRVLAPAARGFRGGHSVLLVTTLLDQKAYPAQALGALYLRRWQVELHFLQLKVTLGMEKLRCQSPAMVEKELVMHLIAYNLVRVLMQQAAHRHQVSLERLSFRGSLDVLAPYADAIYAASGRPGQQQALIDALLAALARQVVPARPQRRGQPRAVKRRRKNYPLLTRPREKMGRLPHRNWHGELAQRRKEAQRAAK